MTTLSLDASPADELVRSLLDTARAMVPRLRAQVTETNARRQVSAAIIQEMKDAGFFKVLQSRRFGGYELPPRVYLQIVATLAEGCMSTAWVYAVLAVHNWQLALFDERAAKEMWADDPSILASSSYMPVGKVTAVKGGYHLSGRWNFSSGSAHAQWVILGANLPIEEGRTQPEPCCFLLPRADYSIIENWDVMGLKGTGSNDILVEGAFVPEHRTLRDIDMFELRCPGHRVNTSALYKVPFAQLFNRTVSTSSVGALRHALNVFIDATRQRRATYTGERLARDTTIQFAVAKVERTIQELMLTLEYDANRIYAVAQQDAWTVEERAALGASATSMVSRCVKAVDTLMEFSGAKAIFNGNVIQQAFLDIHCARAHVANNPYPYARNLGAIRFGFENSTLDI